MIPLGDVFLMNIKTLASLTTLTAALVACGGGDINIDAQNNSTVTDNSVSTGGESETITCASYTDGNGANQTGQVVDDNCFYSESFVDFSKPLTTSVSIPNIGEGAHIFAGSIYVGENYDTLADAAAAGINRGGDGPTLSISAGVTIAFQNAEDLVVINRGSRIEARGTSTAPITFTSQADIEGNVTPEEVGAVWLLTDSVSPTVVLTKPAGIESITTH